MSAYDHIDPARVISADNDDNMAVRRFCAAFDKQLRAVEHELWKLANVEYQQLGHPAVPDHQDRPGGPTIRERVEQLGLDATRVSAELLAAMPPESEPDRTGLVDRVLEEMKAIR